MSNQWQFVFLNGVQRFAAWRSGGFLAQKFNRRTALEPTTKLSYEALNPPLRQTAVRCCPSFLSCCCLSILLRSWCVGLVALLQNLDLAWACAVLQMCHQMRWLLSFNYFLFVWCYVVKFIN